MFLSEYLSGNEEMRELSDGYTVNRMNNGKFSDSVIQNASSVV